MSSRKIIHIDMDAFYASVEQNDNPELRGKPIAIGSANHGVVVAASYEARVYGIHSAMPSKIAKNKCKNLIFIKPNFPRYREVSAQIRAIFYTYTDMVEPVALDEAYLDVTKNKKNISSASKIAEEIRSKILEETGLTASAGVSINKFLAKVASDINKPNGQKTITPKEVIPFLEKLPIEKFHGIGSVTAQKMYQLGIYNGKHLRNKNLDFLISHFGKLGQHYYHIVRGIHHSSVKPNRVPKSIGIEHTFLDHIDTEQNLDMQLKKLSENLFERLKKKKRQGKTLTLKIRYKDFSLFTRSKTLEHYFYNSKEIYHTSLALWASRPLNQAVRLLGLSISNLDTNLPQPYYVQLKIPYDFED